MIKHWQLSNFKSIQQEAHLALAPVTIIAGANSSGKSTLLQSILVVAQSLAHKTNYPPVVLNGGFIRLGDFTDVKSLGTNDTAIAIGFECEPIPQSGPHTSAPGHRVITSVSCSISFDLGPPPLQKATGHPHPGLKSAVLTTSLRDSDANDFHYQLRICPRTRQPARPAIGSDVRPRLHRLRDESEQYDVQLDDGLLAELRDDHPSAQPTGCYLQHFLPSSLIIQTDPAADSARAIHATLTGGLSRRRPSPRRAHMFPELPRAIVDFVLRTLADTAGTTPAAKVKAGLRLTTSAAESPTSLSRLLAQLQQLTITNQRKLRGALAGSARFERVLQDSFRAAYPLPPTSHSCALPTVLAEATSYLEGFFARSVRYLGPLRDDPKSLYPLAPVQDPADIGVKGQYTAAVLNLHRKTIVKYVPSSAFELDRVRRVVATRTLEDAVSDWLQYLTVATNVVTNNRGKFGHELHVNVSTGGSRHDLTHVGVGVSQVLPILVLGLLAEADTTLLFEQPELHLHPGVQTLLGDFFLSMGHLGKQCIVETHSEHIVNRLRLRSAMEPESLGRLIQLFFVDRNDRGSVFQPVAVNEYGAIPDWPVGFFDQSQREAERILRVAATRRRARPARRAK